MKSLAPILALVLMTACGGGGTSAAPSADAPSKAGGLAVPAGFTLETIAQVDSAHGLAFLPNGDLLVGTGGSQVALVPQADAEAGAPHTFATLPDNPAYGVAFAGASIYVATQHALWRIPYGSGDRTAAGATKIAAFRTGGVAPGSDGDIHRSASVAIAGAYAFVGVGSSCNACTETDPTRATVQRVALDGGGLTLQARRFRNALALAVNPATGTLWAGGAGQDALATGHPYEFFDSVSLHPAGADYGWPACEENQHAYIAGATCADAIAPRIELPAYSTLMGAAFYPLAQGGAHAFPAAYRGGAFITAHGSWHKVDGHLIPPRVVFVPLAGDTPRTPVDWSNPAAQWTDFVSGFQDDANDRVARPTGIAVGPSGSLFVADDQNGNIYRIRPV